MYLVCGEALYDVFLNENDGRGSVSMNARAGGSPFNVAFGLARLDEKVALLSGISSDVLGSNLVQLLESEAVSTEYLVRSGRRTTLSLVTVNASGQPEYVFYGLGSADCSVTSADLPPVSYQVKGLHFGSYSLVVKPVADAFASLLEQAGDRFVSLDPNVRPTIESDMQVWRDRVDQYSKRAHLLKISAEDMEYLYPGIQHPQQVDKWLESGVDMVVITDGDKEVRAWTRSGLSSVQVPMVDRVVDTVGAGDTFQAALLAQLAVDGDPRRTVSTLDQQQLDHLLKYAARAASITCSRRGADLPYLREL